MSLLTLIETDLPVSFEVSPPRQSDLQVSFEVAPIPVLPVNPRVVIHSRGSLIPSSRKSRVLVVYVSTHRYKTLYVMQTGSTYISIHPDPLTNPYLDLYAESLSVENERSSNFPQTTVSTTYRILYETHCLGLCLETIRWVGS